MGTFVLTDVTAWIGGYDFTTDSNQVAINPSIDIQDCTTYGGNGWRSYKPGLRTVEGELAGFWDSPVDADMFADLGLRDDPATFSPTGSVTDSTAYMFQSGRFSYQAFGAVGEMCPFSASMRGTNSVGLVRGQVAAARGNVSATGVLGSAVNLGAGAAGKFLYAAFHIFTAGTTITVQVQSDNAEAFSSPTTVATIGPLTAVGGTWMARVDASAIADNWYRLNVSAITGTFNVAGAIAVQ